MPGIRRRPEGDGGRACAGALRARIRPSRSGAGGTGRPPALLPAVSERFAPQISYIDHYGDAAETRFARFRATRVAVLGDGPVARWCVLSLIRNGCATVGVDPSLAEGGGVVTPEEFAAVRAEAASLTEEGCPVELPLLRGPDTGRGRKSEDPGREGRSREGWAAYEEYDVVVTAAGPGVPGVVLPLLREGVPRGRTLLPAWTFGGSAVVGPTMTSDSAACWSCAALRLGAAGGAAASDAAELWSGLALGTGTPGTQPAGPLAAMLGNLLGYEVFRLVTGALPAETRDKVLVQSMTSLDVASEPLLAHPRCPFCSTPRAFPNRSTCRRPRRVRRSCRRSPRPPTTMPPRGRSPNWTGARPSCARSRVSSRPTPTSR